MPTANPGVVALFPIQEGILNKDDGTPLSAGLVYFYHDDLALRTVLKDIYQQVQLSDNTYDYVAINNPITLTSIGTFADDNGNDIIPFLWPYQGTPSSSTGAVEKYFIQVYASAAPVGDGSLQFTRDNWPPNIQDNPSPTDSFEATFNEISNTQFAKISFSPSTGVTYSVTGTDTVNPIAPNWDLVTTGSGTVTVSQVDVVDATAPSNPAFAIDISSSGASLTSIKLRQRLYNSPRLLAGDYASTNIVANSQSGSAVNIVINYVSSNGTTIELLNESTTSTGFSTLSNSESVLINTVNPDPGSTGYVDFEIVLPLLSHVQLTCVQMVGVQNITSSVQYLQQTTEQETLKYQLEYKQNPSFLVGWDFPFNPAQFATGASRAVAATAIGANKSKYAWDQTIVYQSANSGVGVTSGSAGEMVLTAAATTQMAIIQYLDHTQARKALNSPLCVNVSAKASVATKATVSLWYTTNASLPVMTTLTGDSIVLTLDANGKPATRNGTWSEVPRLAGNALITIATASNTNFNDYSLSGWDMKGIAACNTATFFAIVIGTASISSGNTVSFNSVSLQAGTIPTRPAPQTPDQILRECEYYFERSYAPDTLVGDASLKNSLTASQGATADNATETTTTCNMFQRAFGFNWKQTKRAAPTVTLYSTNGAASRVRAHLTYHTTGGGGADHSAAGDVNYANFWTEATSGTQSINYFPTTASINNTPLTDTGGLTSISAAAGWLTFHYVADARLGVV